MDVNFMCFNQLLRIATAYNYMQQLSSVTEETIKPQDPVTKYNGKIKTPWILKQKPKGNKTNKPNYIITG